MRDRRESLRSLKGIPVEDHDKDRDKQADAERLMAVMALRSVTVRRSSWRPSVRTKRGGRGGTGLFSGKTVRRIYEYGDHKRKINLK